MTRSFAQRQERPTGSMSQDDYKSAEGMTLRCDASSVQAIGFTEGLLETLPWPRPVYQAASQNKRRTAVRALLADLLRLEAQGLAGYHGMSPKDFPSALLGFGYDVFTTLRDAMVSAGLLTFEPGRPRWSSFAHASTGGGGPLGQHGGFQARFRLTSRALEEAREGGIELDAWSDHWSPPAPLQLVRQPPAPAAPLIELRAAKELHDGGKRKGHDVPYDPTLPILQPVLADLQAHNAFMQALGVTGIDFIGLRRIFNNGDVSGYAWDQGGRFYSLRAPGMGEAYETLPGRERRKRVRLGGEPVAEMDLSASQLRLLYALLDEKLSGEPSEDLYAVQGTHRDAVKLIVTQAIGKGSVHSRRWGGDASAEYRKAHPGRTLQADHPFAKALAATLAAHPILKRLGGPGVPTALELQHHESEVLRRAMKALREAGIGSLPVHDSLIIPLNAVAAADHALREGFKDQVKAFIGRHTQHRALVKLKASEFGG